MRVTLLGISGDITMVSGNITLGKMTFRQLDLMTLKGFGTK